MTWFLLGIRQAECEQCGHVVIGDDPDSLKAAMDAHDNECLVSEEPVWPDGMFAP